jgi:hypothetical protein
MSKKIVRVVGYTGRRQVIFWPSNLSWGAEAVAYLWGAGGGGAGNDAYNVGGAGGGAPATYKSFTMAPGDVLEVSVGGQGGAGRSSQSGAPGGDPGPSLVVGSEVFNTLNIPNTNRVTRFFGSEYRPSIGPFLYNYGVWPTTGASYTWEEDFAVNFPTTGVYTFTAASFGPAKVFLDNDPLPVVSVSWVYYSPTQASVNRVVSAGTHVVRIQAQIAESGSGEGPGVSFAAFALLITAGSAFSGGAGGHAGFSGSSGGGGGGGGATVLRKNGVIIAVAGGGGGGGGAGIRPGGGQPGNAGAPQTVPSPFNGGDGEDKAGDGGGGGGGGGGWDGGGILNAGGGDGGAQAPGDNWGFPGRYGGTFGEVTYFPSNRIPGGLFLPYYPGFVGYGGTAGRPGNPGYCAVEFTINGTFIKDQNTWKRANDVYIKDSSWKAAKGSWIRSNSQWLPIDGTEAPNWLALNDQFGYVSRTGAERIGVTVCVSVIDEASDAPREILNSQWQAWTQIYPLRLFKLLQPGGPSRGSLGQQQTAFQFFAGAQGPVAVNRDGGNPAEASDWFTLCNLGNINTYSRVLLSIDNSGSMTTQTVAASRDLFLARCNAAGVQVVELPMGGPAGPEDWISPFFYD